jgi:hypothetical protein
MMRRISQYAHAGSVCLMMVALLSISIAGSAQTRRSTPLQFPVPDSSSSQNQTPMVLKMSVNDGRITAEIVNAPQQTVLEDLAARTGIIFEVRTHDNPPLTLKLDQVSLQEAIRRIAKDENSIYLYSPDAPNPEHIRMVRIYPSKNDLPQPSIIYLGTGKITKQNDE